MDKETSVRGEKRAFIEFMLESGVLTFGDFITKSGRKTPYFVNTGNYQTGAQAARLGQFYASCVERHIQAGDLPDDLKVLYGPAYKGIPLAVATAVALADHYQRDLYYCFNRKEAKDHGEGGTLIGYQPNDQDEVLITEDVITAGTAIRETIPILKAAADVRIAGLIVSVDRMEKGRSETSAIQEIKRDFGIRTFPLVTIREIFDLLFTDSDTTAVSTSARLAAAVRDDALKQRLAAYMDAWCVN